MYNKSNIQFLITIPFFFCVNLRYTYTIISTNEHIDHLWRIFCNLCVITLQSPPSFLLFPCILNIVTNSQETSNYNMGAPEYTDEKQPDLLEVITGEHGLSSEEDYDYEDPKTTPPTLLTSIIPKG